MFRIAAIAILIATGNAGLV